MRLQTKKLFGFTLVEVVIAMAVFAILVSIALASYQGQRRKALRAVALTQLTEIATRQEAQRLKTSAYAETFAPLIDHPGTTVFLDADGQVSDTQSAHSLYQLELINPSANSYLLRAKALSRQAKDTECAEFSIDHLGQRLPATNACWSA